MSPLMLVQTTGGGEGVAGPAAGAGPAGTAVDPAHSTDTQLSTHIPQTRSFTMFQALYADLARAHRKRRQREYQRRLEAQAQQELLFAMPRMLAR